MNKNILNDCCQKFLKELEKIPEPPVKCDICEKIIEYERSEISMGRSSYATEIFNNTALGEHTISNARKSSKLNVLRKI